MIILNQCDFHLLWNFKWFDVNHVHIHSLSKTNPNFINISCGIRSNGEGEKMTCKLHLIPRKYSNRNE